MTFWNHLLSSRLRPLIPFFVLVLVLCVAAGNFVVFADGFEFGNFQFLPGNLVVSRSVYDNNPANVQVGQTLPPNCVVSTGSCVLAVNDGTFPYIFNDAPVDGSFGITSRIFLDQLTPFGWRINSLEVPNSLQRDITSTSNQLVTSYSSKSELALHLSSDGKFLTFMGYVSPVNALDER